MKQDPEITVYITNKNYSKYIRNAINSVLKQSFKNVELIIIDDASTDNSKKIINSYKEKKNIKIIFNKKSIGLLKSSNIAIKSSKGKFVLRLDADDYLDINALSVLYLAIKKNPNIAMIYSDYYLVDEKKNIISLEKQIYRQKNYLGREPVLAACCLIRKSALFSVNLYDERFNRQDGYDIWYKLIRNYQIKHVPLPLFFYRRHGQNLTTNKSKLFKTRTKILKKFARQKLNFKNLNINCVIPVRGKESDINCNSLELLNKKPLIFHTIDHALKVKEFKNVIVTTSDKKLISIIQKKYKKKIKYHKRKENLSSINTDYKVSIISALKKFRENKTDILVVLTMENPHRQSHYIVQAISNLIINESDLVIGTKPDIENNYYIYSNNSIKLISNQNKDKLKLEKNIILKEVGSFSVYKYSSYIKNKINKITNIVLDDQDSMLINNKLELNILNKLKK